MPNTITSQRDGIRTLHSEVEVKLRPEEVHGYRYQYRHIE